MILLLIAVMIVICAFQAVRSERLLFSALWLAGASALTALLLYLLDAPEVAVIELSVGAGLVTVLFVFAINIAGEEFPPPQAVLPRPLALGIIVLVSGLLAWLLSPLLSAILPSLPLSQFSKIFWDNRTLDALLQSFLIFAGVLSVLGLLAEKNIQSNEDLES